MTSSSYLRDAVKRRDHGVCAGCGLDTKSYNGRDWLIQHGYSPDRWQNHLWEADHIIAVVDGGADLGLHNIQTLCVPCHTKKTAELAKRRAQERREAA